MTFQTAFTSSRRSRSTWACELKLKVVLRKYLEIFVTLHVSVWVEIFWYPRNSETGLSHAPRERVSWNSLVYVGHHKLVSSRSTWACELKLSSRTFFCRTTAVTLHVSVWVEIQKFRDILISKGSRSTWACELKYRDVCGDSWGGQSRSTWACELKSLFSSSHVSQPRHAPRERVSWNHSCKVRTCKTRVTLHVSVWVEIQRGGTVRQLTASRSTWACELK